MGGYREDLAFEGSLKFSSLEIDDKPQQSIPTSPDGTKIAYYLSTEAGYYYVIAGPGGKTIRTSKDVRDFIFSPNGKHYAYKALLGDKRVAVVDGSEGQDSNEIYKIVFSSDGQRYAYMADRDGKRVVVVDGREEGPYDSTSGDPIIQFWGTACGLCHIQGRHQLRGY